MTVVIPRVPFGRPRASRAVITEARNRQRRRRRRIALMLAIAVTTGGIGYRITQGAAGTRTASDTPAAVPNACAMLTNAEVAKAFGSKIETRTAQGNGRYQMCTWLGPALGSFTSARAQLIVQVMRRTRAQFDTAAKQAQDAARINGVGQAAYATTGVLKSLNVWQHGYALFIVVGFVSNPLQTEIGVARAAVAHL